MGQPSQASRPGTSSSGSHGARWFGAIAVKCCLRNLSLEGYGLNLEPAERCGLTTRHQHRQLVGRSNPIRDDCSILASTAHSPADLRRHRALVDTLLLAIA